MGVVYLAEDTGSIDKVCHHFYPVIAADTEARQRFEIEGKSGGIAGIIEYPPQFRHRIRSHVWCWQWNTSPEKLQQV